MYSIELECKYFWSIQVFLLRFDSIKCIFYGCFNWLNGLECSQIILNVKIDFIQMEFKWLILNGPHNILFCRLLPLQLLLLSNYNLSSANKLYKFLFIKLSLFHSCCLFEKKKKNLSSKNCIYLHDQFEGVFINPDRTLEFLHHFFCVFFRTNLLNLLTFVSYLYTLVIISFNYYLFVICN